MKNNEILVSVKIQNNNKERTLSFLVIKDTTLKAFIQGVYYGLGKMAKGSKENAEQMPETLTIQECFSAFETYIKTHNEMLVLYTIMGQYAKLNITEESVDELDEKKTKKKNYEMPLSSLGIVTSSQILITDQRVVESVPQLFDSAEKEKTYILRENNTLEYNISTRRLNVIEPTVIDILPAGDMPAEQKGSIIDTIAPPLITGLGMVGMRFLIGKFTDNSAFNSSMMAMTIAMPFMSAVNSVYGRTRQSKQHKESVADWKEKYEKYINDTIIRKKIVQWQTDEIIYLNKAYPKMGVLFLEAGEISTVIFARSQNDNDFMRISLGESDEIKPSFEIKAEQKDDIFYDIKYKLYTPQGQSDATPQIEIIILPKKKKKKGFQETASELKNQFLLTELPYIFSTTQYNEGENGELEQTGFKYLRDTSGKGRKPPLLIDLRNMGTLGVISRDNDISINFIRHLAFELAFYHSPEDLQMVFFFNKENNVSKQNSLVEDYMFLPHTNELFDNLSQFIFDEKSAGEVFSQLQTIIAERAKSSNSDENDDNAVSEKHTQIVCFVMDDYDIKEKAFSKYIPEAPVEGENYVNSLGLTFIFIQREKGMLPKYCGSIVELDNKRISNRYNLLSHETLSKLAGENSTTTDDIIEYTHFINSYIFPEGTKGLLPEALESTNDLYYTSTGTEQIACYVKENVGFSVAKLPMSSDRIQRLDLKKYISSLEINGEKLEAIEINDGYYCVKNGDSSDDYFKIEAIFKGKNEVYSVVASCIMADKSKYEESMIKWIESFTLR